MELKDNIQFVSGVGPKKAELFQSELGISTVEDLLWFFPFKYIDRTKFYKTREINTELSHIQVIGKIISFEESGQKFKKRLTAKFADETGSVELIWFQGLKWVKQTYKTEIEYVVFGRPSFYNNRVTIAHPEIEELSKFETGISSAHQAFYPSTEKLKSSFVTSRTFNKLLHSVFVSLGGKIPETFPAWFLQKYKLLPLADSLFNIHFPKNNELLKQAQYRLKFEELFYIQLQLLKQKSNRYNLYKGFVFSEIGKNFNDFYSKNLPFELTGAQKKVIKEIRKDLGSGRQMNRLLQGDVGSGKTLVALMSMLIAIDNNFQTCLMAPTEILASQHFQTLQKFLKGIDIEVSLLTGSTKKAQRTIIHENLMNGSLKILVGTHALIEDTVQFKNLGLVIVDEQHRFGVAQRAKLWTKNVNPPHVLIMTATPIPRTLAMTLYGDLEVSVIDELPPGRKPIKTVHKYDSKRNEVFGFMRKQIEEGRQIYVVYPLIKESEKMDYKDLEDGYESMVRAFPPPKYQVSIVHGKMKPQDKEFEMKRFVENNTNIMVATTVIEVGVDVPNASVMVIESAERFGLSQLHQLRGRVGRGADQSYCILMTGYKLSDDGRKRIETMVRTTDGFDIAETDLKLRGPGDLEGTQQSGIPFDLKIANLAKDGQLLQYARNIAEDIISGDPQLQKPENVIFNTQITKQTKSRFEWGNIG
ncbi:MAG: ATP-dependent DNA helicase RecG [Bacteroidetes bacterium GWF2_38_335]|nr:MAG: ATP-dependent DNA helicase RecG [Bacteroidetes bacterium GWF2_38_335]OFY81052.1 MAG: ATP-dependent DNA helicase RecG [Bacteroidetes bacterium RIFOXYA12_FULL_38_20]HBS87632.1 ATP-dependent DNA helicase RecG [Bacteroidales bacterium]